MARAEPKLWLLRPTHHMMCNGVYLIRRATEPKLNEFGCFDGNRIYFLCVLEVKRITGFVLPKGHVVELSKITITPRGKSHEAGHP